jgi:hypothetical protein
MAAMCNAPTRRPAPFSAIIARKLSIVRVMVDCKVAQISI